MSFAGDPPVLLVTGLSGRLGLALAKMLPNALIAGTYLNTLPALPSQAAQPLDAEGRAIDPRNVFAIRADLAKRRECERVVELALARFGRVDHLINSAADLRFHGSTTDAWAWEREGLRQLELNAFAPMRLASILARDFWRHQPDENRARKRSVVNVSSQSGLHVFPRNGQAGYSASKAALNFLTLHMCEDYDPIGVRVNAIAPTAFPAIVPTEQVASSLISLLDSDVTGRIA